MSGMVDLTGDLVDSVLLNGPLEDGQADDEAITVQTWFDFERSATADIPTIIDGLWPEHAFGFVAAPPKKGKTWLGLSLAISVAAGVPAFGHFTVPTPRTVIYLALEGHRAAIRGRIGCLARGMGLNPDEGHDLDNLHVIYKPRGLNLAAESWVQRIRNAVQTVKPALLIVDVLRAAATIKESSNDDFSALRRTLEPISDDGIAIALLHHFGKLTEITKERSAGERMSGAGAMYGAMDAGIFITGSDDGARRLRVEFELRDLATPEPMGLNLVGNPTGVNGGFVYHDSASWAISDQAPEPDQLVAPAAEIATWIIEDCGGEVLRKEVVAYFDISEGTLDNRLGRLWRDYRIEYVGGRGRIAKFVHRPLLDPQQESLLTPENHADAGTLRNLGENGLVEPKSSTTTSSTTDVELPNYGTLPLNHAESDTSSANPQNGSCGTLETPDLQDETSSAVPHSPTESTTTLADLLLTVDVGDYYEDVDPPPDVDVDRTADPPQGDPA
jgi:AAA domain